MQCRAHLYICWPRTSKASHSGLWGLMANWWKRLTARDRPLSASKSQGCQRKYVRGVGMGTQRGNVLSCASPSIQIQNESLSRTFILLVWLRGGGGGSGWNCNDGTKADTASHAFRCCCNKRNSGWAPSCVSSSPPCWTEISMKKHKAGRPSPKLLNPILLSLTAVTRASIQFGRSKSGQLWRYNKEQTKWKTKKKNVYFLNV